MKRKYNSLILKLLQNLHKNDLFYHLLWATNKLIDQSKLQRIWNINRTNLIASDRFWIAWKIIIIKSTCHYIKNCPTRCNTKQSIYVYYSARSLYMFRVSTAPIIGSTQNSNYSLRYWSYFLCSYLPPTWAS